MMNDSRDRRCGKYHKAYYIFLQPENEYMQQRRSQKSPFKKNERYRWVDSRTSRMI